MIRFLILIFFSANVFAATLLNQNVYEREKRIDLMLSFDSVYEGKISKANIGNIVVVTLENATAEKKYINDLNNDLVQKIEILRDDSDKRLLVNFYPSVAIDVIAAKTGDSYGIRLRVLPKTIPQKSSTTTLVTKNKQPADQEPAFEKKPTLGFETKDELEISNSYIFTLAGLLFLALMLFILKRKLSSSKDSWLLPGAIGNKKNKKVEIKFQKIVDSKNKIVLLDYDGREYLTLMGNSNILLDTFQNGEVVTDDSFERVFEQNKEKLNEYLKLSHNEEVSKSDKFKQNAERV